MSKLTDLRVAKQRDYRGNEERFEYGPATVADAWSALTECPTCEGTGLPYGSFVYGPIQCRSCGGSGRSLQRVIELLGVHYRLVPELGDPT